MSELISLIIPVYKVEKYLHRCLDSVISQSYSQLEIILVNDGSPDSCGEICDAYAHKDSRIKVIHKKNGGLSHARNAGITVAKGEYLSFLDSDDWVEVEYIEKLYKLLKLYQCDMAVCNFIKASTTEIEQKNSLVKIYEFSSLEALEALTGPYYLPLVVAWGKLYHRSLFEEIRYPIGRLHEDEFVIHHLIYRAKKIVFTTEELVFYWQREDSIMGKGFNIVRKSHDAMAYKDRAKFYEEKGLHELRDKTYLMAFMKYRKIMEPRQEHENLEDFQGLKKDFMSFKPILRSGKHQLIYKIYYELYYMCPKAMIYMHKLWSALKKRWVISS